jgi:Leucine-rich repeat (LRR) protein
MPTKIKNLTRITKLSLYHNPLHDLHPSLGKCTTLTYLGKQPALLFFFFFILLLQI